MSQIKNFKKYIISSIILILTLITGMFYGVLMHRNELFPYDQIMGAYYYLIADTYGPWSIGVYEGATPFNLTEKNSTNNPVLTGKSVTDIDAVFVADPFMLIKDEKYYLFFEAMNRGSGKGEIGFAESPDGKTWHYKKIIITEKFHLSYPYVFEWGNNYYLIPESGNDLSVRLYKATVFPEKWEFIGNLLHGDNYLDPSIFRYNDEWWMFVCNGNKNLDLYYSKDLITGWTPHPKNPIIRDNKNISRPGGRVFLNNGKMFRLTQDDLPTYGIQVFAFEITKLNEFSYEEKMVSPLPIVTKTGTGWNAAGMHNVDPHKVRERWISVVDGRNK